jgi:rhamnosyltransferase
VVCERLKVAVCIPTLEAAGFWNDLWSSLEAQALQPSEVIVMDSASTDGTAELARTKGCRVVTVPRAEFRHGATRQRAAELASNADIVVYLTQDSTLADTNTLARLVAVFHDPLVGAAYGRQLPRLGANPIEAHARFFNYPENSATRCMKSIDAIGFKAIFFSNSFGAYRKTALKQVGGFPKSSNFGEDTVVAARLLQRGWHISYVADAMVHHSHAYSYNEEFSRYYKIGQLHAEEEWLLREFGKVSGEGRRFVMSELRYLTKHAPWKIPDALARTGMKYVAYQRGRRNPRR